MKQPPKTTLLTIASTLSGLTALLGLVFATRPTMYETWMTIVVVSWFVVAPIIIATSSIAAIAVRRKNGDVRPHHALDVMLLVASIIVVAVPAALLVFVLEGIKNL